MKGYTLLEVVMVVVIMAFGCCIIGSQIHSFTRSWDVELDAKKVQSDIRMVQAQALAGQSNTSVRFDFGGASNRYEIGAYSAGFYADRSEDLHDTVSFTDCSFSIDIDSMPFITFDDLGAPSQGGYITLQDASGTQIQISVEAATGNVTAQTL